MTDYNKETATFFIEELILNEEIKVVVFKGGWGKGKTHFWKNHIEKKIVNSDDMKDEITDANFSKFNNYSYVSLFGIESVSDLKSEIFNNSHSLFRGFLFWSGSWGRVKTFVIIAVFWLIFYSNTLTIDNVFSLMLILVISFFAIYHFENIFCKLIPKGFKKFKFFYKNLNLQTFSDTSIKRFFRGLKISRRSFNLTYTSKLLTDINKIEIVKKYIGDNTHCIENQYIKDMIICFDDVERMHARIGLDFLMGYASELAQQRNCKIIFIMNEDELTSDMKDIFSRYKEKVVDIERTYNPSQMDLLSLVFEDKLKKYPNLEKILKDDGGNMVLVANIRVLLKIKDIVSKIEQLELEEIPPSIIENIIKNIIYLVYCHYIKGDDIGILNIEQKNIINFSRDSSADAKEGDILKKIIPRTSSVLNSEIVTYIKDGYWNKTVAISKITRSVIDLKLHEEEKRVDDSINEAWHLYQNTLTNNQEDVVCAFKKVLDNPLSYKHLLPDAFFYFLNSYFFFKRLDFMGPVKLDYKYIDSYIETRGDLVLTFDISSLDIYIDWCFPDMKEYILKKIESQRSLKLKFSLEDYIDRCLLPSVGTSDDIKYLQSCTKDEFKVVLENLTDEKLYEKIRKMTGLLGSNLALREAVLEVCEGSEYTRHRGSNILPK